MFLGLDLSLQSTGVCALVDSTTAETAALKVNNRNGMDRLRIILEELKAFVERFGGPGAFELAAIEGYAYGASGKNFHIAELGGLVRWHLELWEIPYIVVGPGVLKKFWTGNGNADKVQMCQVTQSLYGRDFLKRDWPGKLRNKPKPDDWGYADRHWRDDENDAFALANVAALYAGAWDRVPTIDQLAAIQGVKLDPQGLLTKAAKERKAGK